MRWTRARKDAPLAVAAAEPQRSPGLVARLRGFLVRRHVRAALGEPAVAVAAGVVVGVLVGVALVALVAAVARGRESD
ncbi:hypothetical protein ACIQUZ_35505 [Streptomyces griseus]|uniref:hypothetical protein n=1 Tax=Streptomyces griseus TaxID=1911 RepID=UPI0037FF202F